MISRFRPTYTYNQILSSFLEKDGANLKLKEKLRDIYKTQHVYLFGQARVGIYVLLKSLEVTGGVLSPAYNCIVVPDAVRFAGMENQFVDISLDDFNMSRNSVTKNITPRSKVLIATHQFGIPCDIEFMKSFAKKHSLVLLEDSAAAMGAKIGDKPAGTFGDAAIISFQDTKVINAVEGGCLLVYESKLAQKIDSFLKNNIVDLIDSGFDFLRSAMAFKTGTKPNLYDLAFKVWTAKAKAYTNAEKSQEQMSNHYLSGMSDFSAKLVLSQISSLEANVKKRNLIAKKYYQAVESDFRIDLPLIDKKRAPAWTRFPIRVNNKELFFKSMISQGVDLAWTFSYSCPEEYNVGSRFPNSRIASKTVIDLPVYPNLNDLEIEKIIKSVKNANYKK